jgi:hypothetical protein
MSIRSLWATNVFVKVDALPKEDLEALHAIGSAYESQYPEAHVPAPMRTAPETSYNILADERDCCVRFRTLLDASLRELAAAEGFLSPATLDFEAVSNLRKFGPMEYAKPHNHRNSEYVAVLFLSLEMIDAGENCHQKMAGNRLHMIDPMPMRSRFLNHNMLHAIAPVPGMLVIHPASLFHTTELNLSNSDLVALVTNVRVVDPVRNYFVLRGADV